MLDTITVDIGTTNVKVGLLGEDGGTLAAEAVRTPTLADEWGTIYDARALEDLVTDFVAGLDPVTRAAVRRITVGGVGESGALVRPYTTLASPLIVWHDQRGRDWIDRLGDAARDRLYRITGLPASANYGLSKAAWAVERLRMHGGDAEGVVWLNVAEYLAARMSGRRRSECSLASRTLALDLNTRTWSSEACAMFGLGTGVLRDLCPATDGVAVSTDFAEATGLDARVRVHVAGHDHMVGAVGADLRQGELLNSTGTTEGLLHLLESPRLDAVAREAKLAGGISCTGREYTLFASVPTGGSAFATLQTMLGIDADDLAARQRSILERYLAGGIDLGRLPLVLPRFRGASLPTEDPAARAVMAGLGSDVTVDEIVLGCFLGLALQYRDVLDLFGTAPERVKVIGPAAGDDLWLRLKADVLGIAHSAAGVGQIVSRGAQALASGAHPSWDDCRPREILPDPDRSARLATWFESVRHQWDYMKEMPS